MGAQGLGFWALVAGQFGRSTKLGQAASLRARRTATKALKAPGRGHQPKIQGAGFGPWLP